MQKRRAYFSEIYHKCFMYSKSCVSKQFTFFKFYSIVVYKLIYKHGQASGGIVSYIYMAVISILCKEWYEIVKFFRSQMFVCIRVTNISCEVNHHRNYKLTGKVIHKWEKSELNLQVGDALLKEIIRQKQLWLLALVLIQDKMVW